MSNRAARFYDRLLVSILKGVSIVILAPQKSIVNMASLMARVTEGWLGTAANESLDIPVENIGLILGTLIPILPEVTVRRLVVLRRQIPQQQAAVVPILLTILEAVAIVPGQLVSIAPAFRLLPAQILTVQSVFLLTVTYEVAKCWVPIEYITLPVGQVGILLINLICIAPARSKLPFERASAVARILVARIR